MNEPLPDFDRLARDLSDNEGAFDDAEIKLIAGGMKIAFLCGLRSAVHIANQVSNQHWASYKGRAGGDPDGRGDPYFDGKFDGAEDVASAISKKINEVDPNNVTF